MSAFLTPDFLLKSPLAKTLYHHYAATMPIFDFHCHLSPKEIAEDRRFDNLGQIWLEGDHYKWRALRAVGVDESLITGNTPDYQKYLAWAHTVPKALGNPLYHWTHLELRRPFGIENILFAPDTAKTIWDTCNAMLATAAFSVRGIMQQMNVQLVVTTDDPIDSLQYHRQLADDASFAIEVLPGFRPDKAFKIELDGFNDYLEKLEQASDTSISHFSDLRQALTKRLDHFAAHGCCASDHGIEIMRFAPIPDDRTLDTILAKRRSGASLQEQEIAQFSTALIVWLGGEYARRGWVMQLHIGAIRNNNSRMYRLLGPDAGFDSIGDAPFALALSRLLDSMDMNDQLPKTILYCLNPRDNEVLATMIGNFQGGGIAGKMQFGSGWWFNDQKDGMLRQLQQLAQMGLISQFIGMLTDSRSFLSYTRHEYFRRILCDLIAQWALDGEIPDDITLLGNLVQDICYHNACRYFARNPAGG